LQTLGHKYTQIDNSIRSIASHKKTTAEPMFVLLVPCASKLAGENM
jgi:hypothetical protein